MTSTEMVLSTLIQGIEKTPFFQEHKIPIGTQDLDILLPPSVLIHIENRITGDPFVRAEKIDGTITCTTDNKSPQMVDHMAKNVESFLNRGKEILFPGHTSRRRIRFMWHKTTIETLKNQTTREGRVAFSVIIDTVTYH